jgi:thiosulfate/3-mercaptopyruvate sulfurtransferase
MNPIQSIIATAALTVSAVAQAATLQPVIDPFTLTDLQDANAVKVLEIRSDADAFATAHIPGAIHIPYGEFRGPEGNPGALPELTALAKTLGSRGFTPEDAVVVVHDGVTTSDFGAAARVYWTLKSVGFTELAILNGGFRAYQKDGFQTATTATQVEPVEVSLSFDPAWYADTDRVAARVDAGEGASLIDARLDAFFAGKAWHGAAAKPGTLPGATHFSFEAFFDKNTPLLKDHAEINRIVSAEGLDQPSTVSYCNTGHWAATNWFVLSEVAEIQDVRLYAASMVEWSNAERPMEHVPSSFEFAILKTQKWFNGLVN